MTFWQRTRPLRVRLLFMLGVVQWLAWSNFRRSGLPAREIVTQLVVILLCVGLTTLVFLSIFFSLTAGHVVH